MRPLTLIPKFDIIQAKCTYGFTQTPLTLMNQNIDLRKGGFLCLSENPKLPIKPNDIVPFKGFLL